MTEPVDEVLRTRRLELVDSSGDLRAVLGVDQTEQPHLTLYGSDGEPRLTLVLSGDTSPQLTLTDARGEPRALLELDADGNPRLGLFDDQGRIRLKLALSPEAADLICGLHLWDGQSRKSRAGFWVQGQGPQLALSGEDRNSLVSLTHYDGGPLLVIHDEGRRPRVIIGLTEDGTSGLSLLDEEGNRIWSAG